MPVSPEEVLRLLGQLVSNNGQVLAGVAATGVVDRVRAVIAHFWRGRRRRKAFDAIWRTGIAAAAQERPTEQWWLPLTRHLSRIRGAFANGRITDEVSLSVLLTTNGVNPELAPHLSTVLPGHLHTALLERAHSDSDLFQTGVIRELERAGRDHGHHHEVMTAGIEGIRVGQDLERGILFRLEQNVAQVLELSWNRDEKARASDGSCHQLAAEDRDLIDGCREALDAAPSLVSEANFREADSLLYGCRSHLVALDETMLLNRAPSGQRAEIAALLVRTDLLLAASAVDAHHYRRAHEICQRAADGARAAGDDDLAFECTYQAGLSLAHAREWHWALPWLERACELRPENAAAQRNRGVVLNALGRNREALEILEPLAAQYRPSETGETIRGCEPRSGCHPK